jgi:hypothetical protein
MRALWASITTTTFEGNGFWRMILMIQALFSRTLWAGWCLVRV